MKIPYSAISPFPFDLGAETPPRGASLERGGSENPFF
jgi:hypothetical protein